jgi:hypothetical protein
MPNQHCWKVYGRTFYPLVPISSERPILFRCCLSVQWPINSLVTILQRFLSKANRSQDSSSSGPPCTWCGSLVFWVHLLQSLFNIVSTSIWWEWSGTNKWPTWSLHSQGICILITQKCKINLSNVHKILGSSRTQSVSPASQMCASRSFQPFYQKSHCIVWSSESLQIVHWKGQVWVSTGIPKIFSFNSYISLGHPDDHISGDLPYPHFVPVSCFPNVYSWCWCHF